MWGDSWRLSIRSARSLFVILGAVAAVACTPASVVEHVRARAATDIECPPDDIKVRDVGAGAYRAIGCGRKVVYVCQEHVCSREAD